MRREAVSCILALLLLSFAAPTAARTRRHRKPSPVTVVLQPFLVARSVAHAVAEPVLRQTARAAVTLATAPIRVAYRTVRERDDKVLQGELIEEEEPVPRAVPFDEAATSDQPFRVAYLAPQRKRQRAPRSDEAREDDEDFAQGSREAEARSGDRPTVTGSRAILRNGVAYAPERAPQSVKNAIWAANSLRRKPYAWGGGHGSFSDGGYDCSGTVSYALHGAGAIGAPLASDELTHYGERGRGRWFTIYARPGHTFAIIAGLRLDTTDFQNGGNTGPRWHLDMRDTRGYVARHPAGM